MQCMHAWTVTDAPVFYVISFSNETFMPPEFQMYIVYAQKDTKVNRAIDGHQIRKHGVCEEGEN